MKKYSKIALFAILFVISIFIISNKSYAAEFKLDVNCDGQKIDLTSETPEMTWNIENILPGESDETYLTISNVGEKDVSVDFKATVENGKEVADILDIKVIKLANDSNKKDEEFFSGKYSELMNLSCFLQPGKSQKYKIITTLPIETGNEFQNKECVVKLNFLATAEKDKPSSPEEPPEIIEQEEVKPPQTGESIAIYVAVGVLVVAVVGLGVSFIIRRKK